MMSIVTDVISSVTVCPELDEGNIYRRAHAHEGLFMLRCAGDPTCEGVHTQVV